MADPHNHTHQQRRHTPRRLSVLAALAMTAALLTAVAAAPAGAVPRMADAQPTWTACLGPATGDAGFTDVADTNTHATNINCLAYYGITTGHQDGTFRGGDNVTRSQMALFLTRAANAADIDLGDVMDQGFTDLDGRAEQRIHAINRLAAKNIMPGRTAETFDPDAHVTRVEMAHHLFTFLDLALDSVLIDRIPNSIEGLGPDGQFDGTGHIELNDNDGDGIGQPVDDYFGDVRRTLPAHIDDIVGAIYELGVTNGTNSEIGERGTFEPQAPVTRAQMASFIIRALGHTNLRPEGLTAQHISDETQVSVRDKEFKPVVDTRVEVISSEYPEDAFERDGECSERWMQDALDPSFDDCRIDVGDAQTDADGNATFPVGSGRGNSLMITCTGSDPQGMYTLMTDSRSDEVDFTVWAWTGDLGDEVDDNTNLFEVVPAPGQTSRPDADAAVFSGGNDHYVKMGETLQYTIQLVGGGMDRTPTGPTAGGDYDFIVTVDKVTEAATTPAAGVHEAAAFNPSLTSLTERDVDRMSPDSSGLITINVTNPDPRPYGPTPEARNNHDVRVTVTVERAPGNTLPLVDKTMGNIDGLDANSAKTTTDDDVDTITKVQAPDEIFSDNPRIAHSLSATAGAQWRLLRSSGNRNSVNVSVLNQYGDAFTDTTYMVTADASSVDNDPNTEDVDESQGITRSLLNTGTSQISYNYGDEGPSEESIVVTGDIPAGASERLVLPDADMDGTAGDALKVYWADRGEMGSDRDYDDGDNDGRTLLVGDARQNELIINVAATEGAGTTVPEAYSFGDDDRFVVEGQVVSMAQFEEIITSDLIDFGTLSWDGYDYERRSDDATWRLDGLTCRAPSSGSD